MPIRGPTFLPLPLAPAVQVDQIPQVFDDGSIFEVVEDNAPYDFVAVAPLADDVIVPDQIVTWDEPESESEPDVSPFMWYVATAPPDEYDVPLPSWIDDTADGSEGDPAPFDFVSSLATDEYDTPLPLLWEDFDDGSETDTAPWDFTTWPATEEHDVPGPGLPENTDDGLIDEAPYDFVVTLATEDLPPEEPPAKMPSWRASRRV